MSKGAQLALLNSTLAFIPNYYMSLFTIPRAVANDMEAKFRNFRWNDSGDHHRYHLVDWNSICRPVSCGGLGLRSIRDHNRVMLAKWLWRYGMEKENLWRVVVAARFGEVSLWATKEVRVRHGCGL